ncbi:MAG: helix-hairpin-helix domain-containing protein [Planctomycetales bacterium]|nr:helix-hairpin-helix domain-containing protein [Planctomycetales bacterium]
MAHTEASTCSQRQQKLLLWVRGCLLAAGVGLLGILAAAMPLCVSYQKPPLEVLPERINPNTAPAASLVRLPGIGKARAMDIVHYRQTNGGGEPVFKTTSDLEAIKGIGPKTVETLAPWLTFEEE